MIFSSLLVCATLGAVGIKPEVIDAFSYADAAQARGAWKSSEHTPGVDVGRDGGRSVVTLRVPFGSDGKLPRTIIDRNVKLDLSVPGEFALEVALDPPRAGTGVNLYFRSGDGWYTGHAALTKSGWQTIRFSKAGFHIEGQPVGWQQIDTIRISVWRAQSMDAILRLGSLKALAHEVAIVVPGPGGKVPPNELKTVLEVSQRMAAILGDLGLGADAVDEAAAAGGALGQRKIAILAYNPRLAEATIAALEKFVAGGGRLIACYQLPPRLAKILGIGQAKWYRSEQLGGLAEMRFDTPDAARIAGLPQSAKQMSWNATIPEPAPGGAQIIAHWYDEKEQPTGKAAITINEHGAFISHVVLGDDPAAKRQLIAALVGHFNMELWQTMAETAMSWAHRVGPYEELGALRAEVEKSGVPAARSALEQGLTSDRDAQAACQRHAYPAAVEAAKLAHERLAEAYLRAQPSQAREGRGLWNHSGTGAYPGDWERSAKELAAAGFNQIFPNMLWGGLAHYASDVLPRSATFEKYGDQIEQCLAAARHHGLEVHVWKVNWNLSTAPREFVDRMRSENRTIVSTDGTPADWLCPSNPKNFELERDAMLEVARKYAVDGLHFDYIRYPGPHVCFCDGCRQRFEAESGRVVAKWPADCRGGERKDEYNEWRCRNITRLVEAVAREARKIRPGIKISAAVFGSYPDCRHSVGQDWVLWAQKGYLDFACPMDYTESDLAFSGLVENQLRLVEGKMLLYPGIGASASRSLLGPDRVAGQVAITRRLGAAGYTIFDFSPATAKAVIPGLGLGAGSRPAAVPHRK